MNDPIPNELLLTRAEAAKELRATPGTLYRWARDGKGPKCIKLGGRYMYRPSELRAFVEQAEAA